MKILHTGDVHLDSPFSGLDVSRSETRRRELRQTFSSMMRYARENSVDLVLIAGDLVDSAFVTRETISLLVREFASLSCPVIIAPGNHDPADSTAIWQKTPFTPNVHIFTDNTLSAIELDGLCTVYGYAFTSQYENSCCISGEVEDRNKINILLAHCDTSAPIGKYAPTPVAVLKQFGADYAALGHIHTPDAANAALEGIGAYCGCPEGRDFGELGEKGALLVTIEKNAASAFVKTEKIRFCKRIYKSEQLSVDLAGDQGAIREKLRDFCLKAENPEETLLRVTLTGRVEPSLVINTSALSSEDFGLFALEVRDNTLPTANAEALLSDKGIGGQLYRVLLPRLESADAKEREVAALALRYATGALAGEDISDI